MLELENVKSVHGSTRPLTLAVPGGQCLALRGPSGSGKSLLLRAVADLDPHQGTIRLNGQDMTTFSGPDWRRRVVYVPTESGWWDNIVEAHMPGPATAWLAKLRLPEDALAWPVARLSTGEKQRLALLRALSLTPDVLLLDEPTATLDSAAAGAVEQVIRDELSRGAAVILVSHDDDQANRLSDRILDLGEMAAVA